MILIHHKFFNQKSNGHTTRQARFLPAIFLVIVISGNMTYGQSYYNTQANPADTNQKSTSFPLVAYTQDHRYEADMTWEPHDIMTDKKIIFIFQFYDGNTGYLIPDVDYQFVITQDGKELARIPGTTSQAGDYKYFSFNNTGPVTISLEKIADTDTSVSYDTAVTENLHPSGPVNIVQPPPNISDKEKIIFPVLEDIFVGVLIAFLVWIARKPLFSRLRAMQ